MGLLQTITAAAQSTAAAKNDRRRRKHRKLRGARVQCWVQALKLPSCQKGGALFGFSLPLSSRGSVPRTTGIFRFGEHLLADAGRARRLRLSAPYEKSCFPCPHFLMTWKQADLAEQPAVMTNVSRDPLFRVWENECNKCRSHHRFWNSCSMCKPPWSS